MPQTQLDSQKEMVKIHKMVMTGTSKSGLKDSFLRIENMVNIISSKRVIMKRYLNEVKKFFRIFDIAETLGFFVD